MAAYLDKSAELLLEVATPARVCLSWDLFPGSVKTDLDCAALAFDSSTTLIDACYYNKLSALNGAVQHSGDEQDGTTEGFDEVITLDLPRLPPEASLLCFVVNAYQGGTLADVETAYATLQQEGKGDLARMSLCCGKNVAATATVCFLMYCKAGTWCVRNVQTEASGRTFIESYPAVLSALTAVVDPALMVERRASMDKTFQMKKSDVLEIPPDLFISGEDLFVGLGWTSRCDLDAAVIVADNDLPLSQTPRAASELGQALSVVNFQHKTFGRAVVHHGDNQTGAGAGDDERIDIDLDYMPDDVKSFWVVVNIYTSGQTFAQVRGAYIRLVAAKNKHELCRFALEDGSVSERGLVLAKVSRNAVGRWCVHSVGKGCDGVTANDSNTLAACDVGSVVPLDVRGRVEREASGPNKAARTWTVMTLKLRGVNLAAKDSYLMGGKSDPYFEVWESEAAPSAARMCDAPHDVAVHRHRLLCRSETVARSLNPDWRAVRFEVRPGWKLRLLVWDYDRTSASDLIGFLQVGPMEALASGSTSGLHKLSPPPPPHKQEAGSIEIVSCSVETRTEADPGLVAMARACYSERSWLRSCEPGPMPSSLY